MAIQAYIFLAIIIFFVGVFGILVRRSAFFYLMSLELMLNSANLLWVAFAKMHGNLDGHVFAFFIMALAAAEACVGLAIVVLFYRKRNTVTLDRAREMSK
jgi:NADH:ubiquinone oxidoreductase subunit K